MARIKYSEEIAGIRGSAAGLTYSANRAGPYIKRWTLTPNPNSAPQLTARYQLTTVTQLWRLLPEEYRTLWDAFALDPPETDYDPFGETIILDGFHWHTRINTRLTRAGQPPLQTPPPSIPATPVTILALEVAPPDPPPPLARLFFPIASFADGSIPAVTATFTLAPPPGFPTTGFRQTYLAPPTAANYLDFPDALIAAFGAYRPGWYCHATLRRQSPTGIRSTQTQISTLVEAL